MVFLLSFARFLSKRLAKIDQLLVQIKAKYGVERNNQVAILCRNNSGVKQYDNFLKTPHKAFEETPLDKVSSEWGRFFCSLLSAYFSPRTFAVDFTETLFTAADRLQCKNLHYVAVTRAIDACYLVLGKSRVFKGVTLKRVVPFLYCSAISLLVWA